MQITFDDAKKYNIVPFDKRKGVEILLCKDLDKSKNFDFLNELIKKFGENIQLIYDKKFNFDKMFEEYYSMIRLDEELKNEFDTAISKGAKEFFEHIVKKALYIDASDIHIFDNASNCMIKLRINGQLITYSQITKEQTNTLIRIIKLSCGLDISRTIAPTEGRFTFDRNDFRVSIVPTVDGEKIDIRILGNTKHIYRFDDISLDITQQEIIKKHINKNSGLILVTGPTGSGKSTTLFTMMHYLNDGSKNIISIEDPVEYKLDGVTQIQISHAKSIEVENILKFVLRQDPEIINIGEIRDEMTARLAIRASNTGHLVLSTMHTNSSISAIGRLLDLGIEPYEIISSLSLIISQRLVRQLCPDCKIEYTLEKNNEYLGLKAGQTYFKSSHCKNCFGTGYFSQKAIFEILELNQEVKNLIKNNELTYQKINIKTLKEHLLNMLEKGETSVEEISKYI